MSAVNYIREDWKCKICILVNTFPQKFQSKQENIEEKKHKNNKKRSISFTDHLLDFVSCKLGFYFGTFFGEMFVFG